MGDGDWRVIADDPPPHETLVLLYWMDWRNQGYMEAGYASTGERFPNGYSTISHHGDATHWMPLPAPPSMSNNPLTGEPLLEAHPITMEASHG